LVANVAANPGPVVDVPTCDHVAPAAGLTSYFALSVSMLVEMFSTVSPLITGATTNEESAGGVESIVIVRSE